MGDSMPTGSGAAARQPPPQHAPLQHWTAYLLEQQAAACRVLGSQLYDTLLTAAARDVAAGGPAWDVLAPHATRSGDSALALRFMAAVHRLVLTRAAPELALHFPSVGGTAGPERAWGALREALESHSDRLAGWVGRPCQTNEVGRCAALIGGFLTAATETGLPLRMLEIGASAGLNLRWDRYSYRDTGSGTEWGDPESPVRLHGHWEVPAVLARADVAVAGRAGCDPRPIDPSSAEGRLDLTASVWGDQPRRFERLRGALQVAESLPVVVESATAGDWLPLQLAGPADDVVTVVYHSVVLQYLEPGERTAVVDAISVAGARASSRSPLYWVRMEPEEPRRAMALRVTRWPGGGERLLARAGAHGDPVRWHKGRTPATSSASLGPP